MPDNIIDVGTRVNTAPLTEGMEQGAAVVKESTTRMGGFFGSLAQSVKASTAKIMADTAKMGTEVAEVTEGMREKFVLTAEGARFSAFTVGSSFGALGALLGASLLFEFFDHVKEGALEMGHLSEATGISVAKIAELRASMQQSGASGENFDKQLSKLSRSMLQAAEGGESQAEAFRLMGIDVKAWGDELPPADQILMQMADHLQHSTKHTQDLAAATTLLGRGSLQTVAWLKQGSDAIVAQAAANQELGFKAQTAADSAKDLQRQEAQLSQTVMGQLLPAFSFTVTAIDLFVGGLIKLKAQGEITFRLLMLGAFATWDAIKGVAMVVKDVLSGNLDKVGTDAKNAWREIKDDSVIAAQQIVTTWKDADNATTALFAHGAEESEREQKDITLKHKDASKTRIDDWKDELEQQAIDANKYHILSLDDELTFWQGKLAIAKVKGGEQKAVRAEIRRLEQQEGRDELAEFLAKEQDKINALKVTDPKRVAIERHIAEVLKEIYGENSANYQRQLAKITEMEKETTKAIEAEARKRAETELKVQQMKLAAEEAHAKAVQEIQRDLIESEASMGLISAQQKIQLLKGAEQQEYQQQKQALEARRALARQYSAKDPANPQYITELQSLNNQVQGLEDKHNRAMLKLDEQSLAQRKRTFDSFFSTISTGFAGTITGMMQGTQTFWAGLSNIFNSILGQFISMLVNMGVEWVAKHLFMLIFANQIEAEKTAVATTAATVRAGTQSALNMATIFSEAAVAAATAYAFWAWNPPAAAIAATTSYAAVADMAPAAMFEQGGLVKRDMVAGLHAEEMVLPAKISKPLQNMIEGGGPGGRREIHLHSHTSVMAMDGESAERALRKHGDIVGEIAISQIQRAMTLGRI